MRRLWHPSLRCRGRSGEAMEGALVAWRLAFESGRGALPSSNSSLHGATEQTMEEVGWLGRPTWVYTHGTPYMARHVRHHCFRCRTVPADPRKDALHAGTVLASSSVRSCHSMLVQVLVDSEATGCCISSARHLFDLQSLLTEATGFQRLCLDFPDTAVTWCFDCSSVWHQHRLRQTGLISDTLWCCWLWMWVSQDESVREDHVVTVAVTSSWRLHFSRSSDPELLLDRSLHGATEQTMEEDGWLGRPA